MLARGYVLSTYKFQHSLLSVRCCIFIRSVFRPPETCFLNENLKVFIKVFSFPFFQFATNIKQNLFFFSENINYRSDTRSKISE